MLQLIYFLPTIAFWYFCSPWGHWNCVNVLTLFRMGLIGAAYKWGDHKDTFTKICHTHPKMMKLSAVIPYAKKIQKIYVT